MEAPAILVTGERRRSGEIEIEKVEKGGSEEGRKDNSEKGKVRGKVHGEGLNVRLGREGRRKSETPQLRKKEEQAVAGEAGEKAKEGQIRKRDEKTRSVGKRGEDRLATQGNKGTPDEEEGGGLRSRKGGSSPHPPPPSSSLLLGADLGLLRGRQGRRKSEVCYRLSKSLAIDFYRHVSAGFSMFLPNNLVNIHDHI